MNYPENIYRTYEIAEKEIFGEKHFALVRVYNFLGIKFCKFEYVEEGWYKSNISFYGQTWHPYKSTIQDAILSDNETQERKFRNRVTK